MTAIRSFLLGILAGIALTLAAYGVRAYELRMERLELHVSYIEGFLQQATAR